MRRFTKVCLVIGIGALMAGSGLTAVGAAMGGINFSRWDLPMGRVRGGFDKVKGKVRDIRENIKKDFEEDWRFHWDLDDDDDDVYDGTHGNENSVTFSPADIKKLELEVNQGRTTILVDPKAHEITVSSNMDHGMTAYKDALGQLKVAAGTETSEDEDNLIVSICVPQGFSFDKVELKSEASNNFTHNKGPSINASGLLAKQLELDSDVGAIFVSGADVGSLDASCDVGTVQFKGSVSEAVNADSDVGAIELTLSGASQDYNYDMNCDLGAISLDGKAFAGLSRKKTIDNGASKNMKLKCDTGSIIVKFDNSLDGGKMDAKVGGKLERRI